MPGSSDGMQEALQAEIDALSDDDEPTVAPPVTMETLAERIAHLDSPALHDDTPVSKPKLLVAFETGPPLVGSPELVDLSSIASPVASEGSDDDDDEKEADEDGQSQSDAEATEPKQKPNGSDPTPSGSGTVISGTNKTVTVEPNAKGKGKIKATSTPSKAAVNTEAVSAKERKDERMNDLSYTTRQPNNCTTMKDSVFFCTNTNSPIKVTACLASLQRQIEQKCTQEAKGSSEELSLITVLKKELEKKETQLRSKDVYITTRNCRIAELTANNEKGTQHVRYLHRDLGVTRDLLSTEKRDSRAKFEAFATLTRDEKREEIKAIQLKARADLKQELHSARMADSKALAAKAMENQKYKHMLTGLLEKCEQLKARAADTHPLNHAPSHHANQRGRERPSATSGHEPRFNPRMCPTQIPSGINGSEEGVPLEKRTVAVGVSECLSLFKGMLSSKDYHAYHEEWPHRAQPTTCNRRRSGPRHNSKHPIGFNDAIALQQPEHGAVIYKAVRQVPIPGETGQIFAYSYTHGPSPSNDTDETYTWATPITERQRLYHAAHGNSYRTNNKKCNSPGCELRMYHRFGHTFELMKRKASASPGPNTRGHFKTMHQPDLVLNQILSSILHDTAVTERARGTQRAHQGGISPSTSPRHWDTSYDEGLDDTVLRMHGRALYNNADVIEAMLQLPHSYTWALPMTERQRLHHALHGNTRLIAKIMTDGIPTLERGANSAEQFIEFELDLRGWCSISGCLAYVVGPAPTAPTGVEKLTEHNEKLALGLRYVCAAVDHPDLKSAVASNGNGRGPDAFRYLRNEFLQGTELQPALNILVDSLRLKQGENTVPFKARFSKFVGHLNPSPHANILCAKFTKSVTANTNGFYDDCVTSAQAVDREQDNFAAYATLLTQLCSQKLQRSTLQIKEHVGLSSRTEGNSAEGKNMGEPSTIEALLSRLDQIEAHLGESNGGGRFQPGGGKGNPRGNPRGQNDRDQNKPPSDRPCVKCGGKGHYARDCSEEAVCDFTFPNGERCGRAHLPRFCWFKDPSRCRDPKVRSLIEKKLAAKSTSSGNFLRIEDEDEFHCVCIEESGEATTNCLAITHTSGDNPTPRHHSLKYFCACAECDYGSLFYCTECPFTHCTICDPHPSTSQPTQDDEEEWVKWIDWTQATSGVKSPEIVQAMSEDCDATATTQPRENPEPDTSEGAEAHAHFAHLEAVAQDVLEAYLAPLLDNSDAANLAKASKGTKRSMEASLTARKIQHEIDESEAIDQGYASTGHKKAWARAMHTWFVEVGGDSHLYKKSLLAYMASFDMKAYRKMPDQEAATMQRLLSTKTCSIVSPYDNVERHPYRVFLGSVRANPFSLVANVERLITFRTDHIKRILGSPWLQQQLPDCLERQRHIAYALSTDTPMAHMEELLEADEGVCSNWSDIHSLSRVNDVSTNSQILDLVDMIQFMTDCPAMPYNTHDLTCGAVWLECPPYERYLLETGQTKGPSDGITGHPYRGGDTANATAGEQLPSLGTRYWAPISHQVPTAPSLSMQANVAHTAPVGPPVEDLTVGCMSVSLPPATELADFMFIDTGASDHIVHDSRVLINPREHQVISLNIRTGNAVSRATRRGPASFTITDSNGKPYALVRNVIYCPDFAVNLFSTIKDWKEHGTRVELEDSRRLKLADGTIIPFEEHSGAYRMYYDLASVEAHKGKVLSFPRGTDPASIWHRRIGHQSFETVRNLPKRCAGVSLELTSADATEHQQRCAICSVSRMKATPHPKNRQQGILTKAYGDRIHMDLAGPLRTADHENGGRYVTVFVDEHSGHLGLYVIANKDDHHMMHKQYCADMASYGGMEIKEFHSDNGGEFISNEYKDMIMENGARKTTIVAKTPNLNPYAEGAMYRIFSMVRSMLVDSGLPPQHWGAAALHAVYVLNRTPRRSRPGRPDDHRSPYEMLQGRPPNLSSLKIFGCLAHGMIAKKDRTSKIAEVAISGFYYGHSRTKRGYRLFIPSSGKIITVHTAHFDEHTMYKDVIKPGRTISGNTRADGDTSSEEEAEEGANHLPTQDPGGDAPRFSGASRSLRARGSAIDYDPQGWRFEQGNSSTTTTTRPATTAYLISQDLDIAPTPDLSDECDVVAMIAGRKDNKVVLNQDGTTTTRIKIPHTYDEAMKGDNAGEWEEAIKAEHDAHIENGTWELVPISRAKGKKIVGSTWCFDIKRDEAGRLARFKARLCAQGFSQLEGVDFITTYSNTIHHNTLRLILAVAALRGLHLSGADIKTAYLYGFVEKGIDVYMRQPRGFEVYQDGEPMACRLIRSIYGLRQSGARWEARLVKFLTTKLGFTRSQCDPCLYKIQKGGNYLWLCVYVDDLTFASTTREFRDYIFKAIQEEFKITDTGDLTWILNTNISQDLEKGTVTISQKVYIEDTVRTFFPEGVPKTTGRTTPCDPTIADLEKLAEGEMVDPRFRSGVGKLVWLVAISRPDMAYAHSMLARHNQGGGERHMQHLMKAFAYLGRTSHYKLTYGRDNFPTLCKLIEAHSDFRTAVIDPETLICFTDSSHGGERPMAGELLMIGASVIAWKAYRSALTPLSSCEGEYLAATKAAVEILATQDNGRFLGVDLKPPTILFNDNKAAVMLADSNTSSKRMKHMATRIAFLREQIADGTIMLYHIRTEGQLADIFTKALSPSVFHYLRSYLIY